MLKSFIDKLNKKDKSKDHLVNNYIDLYFDYKIKYPNLTPHGWLATVWLDLHPESTANKDEKEKLNIAFKETYNFSCLAEPMNIKALALWYVYKECSGLLGYDNNYYGEIKDLLRPVYIARKKGSIESLYKKFNS